MTVGQKLLLVFSIFIFSTGSILTLTYMKVIPALMHNQINLRTFSISKSFSASLSKPLLLNDYLMINKAAEVYAALPGVAYICVLGSSGTVVSGIFGDKNRFTPEYIKVVTENGFPEQIPYINKIPNGKEKGSLDYKIDGQKIHDVAVRIGDTGGEAHVGLFTSDIEKTIYKTLVPLLTFWALTAVIGCISFFCIARTISLPIRLLTEAAEKISLGEIDLSVPIKGGGEIRVLAEALERLRISVKTVIERMSRKST